MTTRKRPVPERQRLFLTTALANPGIREIEAESGDAAPFSDVLQAAAFGVICGGMAALVAHGIALAMARSGFAAQLVAFGAVGLIATLVRAGQIVDSRRTRQWARFDEIPESPQTPDFVPTSDAPRTLVLDTPLRPKLTAWAKALPAAGHSLTYRQWVGRGRLFSRAEFEHIRQTMAALAYEKDNALTAAGRDAVGRWAVGNMTAREVHALRPTPPDDNAMHSTERTHSRTHNGGAQ
jgi:hypothetical protein